jgi:hypothetical protein
VDRKLVFRCRRWRVDKDEVISRRELFRTLGAVIAGAAGRPMPRTFR